MSTIRPSDAGVFSLGLLYLLITFCLGWYLGSFLVGIVFCVAISAALIRLTGPPGTVGWRTAIAFSLPSFLAGLVPLRDNYTFLAFALAGFLGSFAGLVHRRSGNRRRSP
ncbi:MAG: hypothetical protein KGJ68_01815 [Gammaproteobacteria bacterium]|nr:hypothetical protein [Gammaproteobacteria bacterium]